VRPDIKTARKYSDLERPAVPIYGATVGSSGLIDNSVTPAKLRHDAQFSWGFDGGELDGLTEWSFGTWEPKVIDGGTL